MDVRDRDILDHKHDISGLIRGNVSLETDELAINRSFFGADKIRSTKRIH